MMDAPTPTTRSEMLRRLTACAHRAVSHRVERVERVELVGVELEQKQKGRSEEERQSGSEEVLRDESRRLGDENRRLREEMLDSKTRLEGVRVKDDQGRHLELEVILAENRQFRTDNIRLQAENTRLQADLHHLRFQSQPQSQPQSQSRSQPQSQSQSQSQPQSRSQSRNQTHLTDFDVKSESKVKMNAPTDSQPQPQKTLEESKERASSSLEDVPVLGDEQGRKAGEMGVAAEVAEGVEGVRSGVYLDSHNRRWAEKEEAVCPYKVKQEEVLANEEENLQIRLRRKRERETSLRLEEAEAEAEAQAEGFQREVDRLKVEHGRGVGRVVEVEGHRAEVGRVREELERRFRVRAEREDDETFEARVGLEEHEKKKEITLLPSLEPQEKEKEKEKEEEPETHPQSQSLLAHLPQTETEPTLQIQLQLLIQTLRLKHRKELREYKLVAQEWKQRAELWEAQVNALADGDGDVDVRVRGGAGRGRV